VTDGLLASQLGPRSRPAAATRALVVGVLQQAIADAVRPDRTVTSPTRRATVLGRIDVHSSPAAL
jgi:hypothetical protein